MGLMGRILGIGKAADHVGGAVERVQKSLYRTAPKLCKLHMNNLHLNLVGHHVGHLTIL